MTAGLVLFLMTVVSKHDIPNVTYPTATTQQLKLALQTMDRLNMLKGQPTGNLGIYLLTLW